jgi:hypothetical protein
MPQALSHLIAAGREELERDLRPGRWDFGCLVRVGDAHVVDPVLSSML